MRYLLICLILFLNVNVFSNEVKTEKIPKLTDVTKQAGIDFIHSIGDYKLSNIIESTGGGVCVFDYNNDGKPDIYFINGTYKKGISHIKGRKLNGKLKNSLYRNNGNGTFSDVSDIAGVGDHGYGMGAVSADYDNDGDADLFITNYGTNVFYRNNGNGTFTDITEKAGLKDNLWSTGATFLDYDRDGFLDLYVGNYLLFDPKYKTYFAAEAFPGPLSYQGQPDFLYRNKGDGTFEDVSKRAGIVNTSGRAMGVASCDLNNDGYMDIYVANDGMENYLYQNNKNGTFSEIALISGVQFGQNGEATSAMGPEFGDYNLDGRIDILVPDMGYSCLYKNTGNGFIEASSLSGIAVSCGQYTSWSGNFFDFDCDGLLDIFISNGDSHHLEPEEDLLFLNQNKSRFLDISAMTGPDFKAKFVSRGSAVLDYDNDGDLDIIVLNLNSRARLLKNNSGNNKNWIKIKLIGKKNNRDAIGAVVELVIKQTRQTRYRVSSSGYLSQSDSIIHFGLGENKIIDKIKIRWPDGKIQLLKSIKSNQTISILEK